MTHTSTELLPCPFCGGQAGETHYQLGWFVACKHECSASTKVTNNRAQAIAAWNRRTPASQAQRVPLSDEQIEQAMEWCDVCEGDHVLGAFSAGVRHAEKLYGITQEKQG